MNKLFADKSNKKIQQNLDNYICFDLWNPYLISNFVCDDSNLVENVVQLGLEGIDHFCWRNWDRSRMSNSQTFRLTHFRHRTNESDTKMFFDATEMLKFIFLFDFYSFGNLFYFRAALISYLTQILNLNFTVNPDHIVDP